MLSDFQKQKFEHLFRVMDASKDGRIDSADLEIVVKRVGESRGPGADAKRLGQLSEKYRFMHQGMVAMADTDKSGYVTPEEWVAYLDKVVSDKGLYQELIGSLTGLFHELIDHNGDDKNDLEDYKVFLGVLQADASDAEKVFAGLDTDKDGQITLDDLTRAMADFYHAKEPGGVGTYFFGRF